MFNFRQEVNVRFRPKAVIQFRCSFGHHTSVWLLHGGYVWRSHFLYSFEKEVGISRKLIRRNTIPQ